MSRFPEVSVPEFTRFLRGQTRGPAGQTLLTADGIRLNAVHRPGEDRDWAFVVCHGFTGSWRGADMARIIAALHPHGGVVAFDFRGHGRSHGRSTVGDLEVLDLHAAVEWARALGYRKVATVGFSMGASVAVRHGGLCASSAPGAAPDAVVSVSGPGWWFERSTVPMRRIHWLVQHPVGRVVSGVAFRTRIEKDGWKPVPESPAEIVHRIAPVPLLVVHGDADRFFPVGHAQALYLAAREPRQLWIEKGFGHAEAATDADLAVRIARWVREQDDAGRVGEGPAAEGSTAEGPAAEVLAAEGWAAGTPGTEEAREGVPASDDASGRTAPEEGAPA